MKISNVVLVFVLGILVGILTIMSCGGDGQASHADAATQCDCPQGEAPLAGRIVRIAAQLSVPPMGPFSGAAYCQDGDVVLSGGCFSNSTDPKFGLQSSFGFPEAAPRGWSCDFYNGTSATVASKAYVTCLRPAP
jgi:hypothetical protein